MKEHLTLVYREEREGACSIERLFGALEPYFEEVFTKSRILVPHRSGSWRGIILNILHVRRHAKGIIHITGDVQYLAAFLPGKKTILTIHDCGYLLNLKGFKKWIYKWLWFKLPCWRAARVTVISESTRKILEEQIGSLGNKLVVIDNCVTFDLSPTKKPFNAARPQILQIGTGHHKNLDTLIKAVDGFDCELKIVGKPSEADLADLKRRNIQHSIESNVSNARIKEIYHECDILYFASRHEGFGLPILEAHASEIPVITSNCYSMPYVAGEGGAILVNPESPDETRSTLFTLCSNENLRRLLTKAGKENVKRFLPESISEKYVNLYRAHSK